MRIGLNNCKQKNQKEHVDGEQLRIVCKQMSQIYCMSVFKLHINVVVYRLHYTLKCDFTKDFCRHKIVM